MRRKCTRQRCQAAPANTAPIAALSPSWASEMTSCATCRPRALSERRNAGPERAVLAVADVEAEDLTVAVGAYRGGDHHGLGDHPPVDPGLAVRRVQEHVRVGVGLQRAVAERGDLLVEVGADPRHPDLEIPVSTPRALTRSSTLRVDTPCRWPP